MRVTLSLIFNQLQQSLAINCEVCCLSFVSTGVSLLKQKKGEQCSPFFVSIKIDTLITYQFFCRQLYGYGLCLLLYH